MALNDAGLDAFTDTTPTATHASLHTAAPGTTGANESTAGRLPIAWTGPTGGGDMSAASILSFTGGEPSGPIAAVGLWTAAVGGTWLGSLTTSGDTAFNADGAADVTSLTIPATAV